jgi:hypothetical protein
MKNFLIILILGLAAAGLTYLALERPRAYTKTALLLLALIGAAMLMLYAWRIGFADGGIFVAAQGTNANDERLVEMTKYMLRLDEGLFKTHVIGFVCMGYILLLLAVSRRKHLPKKS